MKKRRYLLALSVPLLLLTVAFSTRTTAATVPTTTGTLPPALSVWPTYAGPNDEIGTTTPDCTSYAHCVVTLSNRPGSDSALRWTVIANIEDGSQTVFTPSHGVLQPGQKVKIVVTDSPCQDVGGEWDFWGTPLSPNPPGSASQAAVAVIVAGCG